MTLIKLPLKIIAVPFVVVLTIGVAILQFLFCYAEALLNIVSGIFVLIGVVTLIMDSKFNGGMILFLAFLISPFGLPAVANWLIDVVDGINDSLRAFIMS